MSIATLEDLGERAVRFISKLKLTKDFSGEPFVLRPWQEQPLRKLFGILREDGTRQYRRSFWALPRKSGKALAIHTPLATPTGWTTMGEVEVGDTLVDDRDQPCRVKYTTEEMYDHPCYRVKFSDGSSIVADGNHQWVTRTRRPWGLVATRTTVGILETLTTNGRVLNHTVPPDGKDIISVEQVDSVPVRCIQVNSPSRLYLAGRGEIATHNTDLIAAVGLYLMMGQGRPNQQIYTASGDFKQASLIFASMAEMIRQDPVLESNTVIFDGAKRIKFPRGQSTLEVLSSVPKSKHGLSPSCVLVDELHICNEDLINILTTGFGARKDPLTIFLTTAGEDLTSLCYEEWQHARNVRDGVVEDDTYLPVLYEADPSDDWTDEKTWHKAIPALGEFCSLEFIREEFQKALKRPRFVPVFKTFYLNLWVSQATSWIAIERWMACGTLTQDDFNALAGRECYGGIDLGVTGDMSAAIFFFPNDLDGVDVLCQFWVPEFGKWRDEVHNKNNYLLWHEQGYLTFTPGEATDHNQIEDDLVEWNTVCPLLLMTADRAYATQLLQRLFNNHSINVKGIAQGPVTLNEPMVKLETMILDQTLRHTNNPVLAYCVANGKVKKNATGLMFLDKSTTTRRMDGLSAMIDATAGMLKEEGNLENRPSVYEERGVITI